MRHTLNPTSEKGDAEKFVNKSNGSSSFGSCAIHFVVPVMEMPESEPTLVGIAEEEVKPNRTPARLKPTAEPMPIPKAVPTADKFSWDGMGRDSNAESEEQRSRRAAQIKKEGVAAAAVWSKRGQDKNWTEVKADLSVYAYSDEIVSKDPRRQKSYAEGVLKGLGLGPRGPGEAKLSLIQT